MKKLLIAEHWQLIMIVIVVPLGISMILDGLFGFGEYSGLRAVSTVFSACTLLTWYWAIGMYFHKKAFDLTKMRIWIFNTIMAFTIVSLLFYTGLILIAEMESTDWEANFLFEHIEKVMLFHFILICCLLYCLFFVAKTLKTVELKREVELKDYLGDFFLLLFYPIGIWKIQPRVNSLIKTEA